MHGIKNILAIVVTYNRLNELQNCIHALREQSMPLDILIINNGSTDGTQEWLKKQVGLLVINQMNLGGAGGFYTGMEYMMQHGYEWLVMMDDDGVPDRDEIKNLVMSYDFISEKEGTDVILNALVVDKDNHKYTSFLWAHGSNRSNEIEALMRIPYFHDVHPFNGTLIKRSVIEKIGFIKREMFIWGDEKEYMARAVHNGISLITVTSAIHYHPKEKGKKENVFPFLPFIQILVKPSKMSHYYYRNEGFIYGNYSEKRNKMWLFIAAQVCYNITHFRFKELMKFIKYFRKGICNDYSD